MSVKSEMEPRRPRLAMMSQESGAGILVGDFFLRCFALDGSGGLAFNKGWLSTKCGLKAGDPPPRDGFSAARAEIAIFSDSVGMEWHGPITRGIDPVVLLSLSSFSTQCRVGGIPITLPKSLRA
eukprot:CAMPEP_0177637766 /NCGR_PEP_ID=MMETSP0447-20121125/5140_1 /TAXON_ID=0 /ORGANISM="Stygamoeba regulata, Strain BSH-02190019" /LENGTH=123 /DNA_ID=CAMNT_0019139703 /DNA_START=446 /DNA_END=817 /DNA_ORIENTATION=-